jgi:predicted RNA polymerase sigma factor
VVYLIFNEGYTAARGDDLLRHELCDEALRMARALTAVAPNEPEAHGLMALMELNAARAAARIDAAGDPILLADQDRNLWDPLQIRRGLQALARADQLGGASGFYALQAAIIACHVRAQTYADTNWPHIASLYGHLMTLAPSPVIALNRAVAVSMAEGAEAALPLVDQLTQEPALKRYHLLFSVRGDLLQKLGRIAEARADFQVAAQLTANRREKDFLTRRASACITPGAPADKGTAAG